MNKIRQFSFQDNMGQRQSEGPLDLTNSPSSLNDPLNSFRQYNGFPPPVNSKNNPIWSVDTMQIQVPTKYPNFTPENAFSTGKIENPNEIQKIGRFVSEGQKISREKLYIDENHHRSTPNENIDPQYQFSKTNSNNQNENNLNENWDKKEKTDQMLAQHKKKKSSYSRGPLSQVNENIRSLELVGHNDFIEEDTNKFILESNQVQDVEFHNKQESVPTDTDHIAISEVSYSYKDTEERPEQTFSPALNEPFNPQTNSLFNTKFQTISNPEGTERKDHSDYRSEQNAIPKQQFDYIKQMNPLSEFSQSVKESRKNSSKRIPIEEKLRIKNLEREARIAYMREEKSKDDMKLFQSKPQISENSKIIAKYSKRARENAQVIEKLTSPDAKKGKLFVNSFNTSQNQSQRSQTVIQSLDSEGSNIVQRITVTQDAQDVSKYQNVSLYKKLENEPSVSITTKVAHDYGTFNPNIEELHQSQMIKEYQNEFSKHRAITEEETLEMIEPLHHSSSTSSLQKEASDRLAIAMAKKSSSQASSKESHELYRFDQNHKFQAGASQSVEKKLETHFKLQPLTADQMATGIKHPKQVYLKVSNPMMNVNPNYQNLNNNNMFNFTSNQIFSTKELTFETLRNQVGESMQRESERAQTPELIQEGLPTKDNMNIEAKKRSIRQPTFGVSNSNTFTHLSSKLSSFGESPDKGFASNFDPRDDDPKLQELKQNLVQHNKDKTYLKHSQESYLNSLKLRQQKFANAKENETLSTPQSTTKKIYFNEEEKQRFQDENKSWLDIDVYMRNALWLSAKNNKVVIQQTNKEKQVMKECSFHPKLDEKTYRIGLNSPKNKSKAMEIEDKITNNKNDFRSKKSLNSYQYLHGNKTKVKDEKQKKELKKLLNLRDFNYADEDVSEPKISVELREDGQKYYLL